LFSLPTAIQYRQAAWSAGYFASIKFFEKHVNRMLDKTSLRVKYPSATKTLSQLLSGFLAGVFGAALNTPGDTIRSALQKKVLQGQGFSASGVPLTLLGVGQEIVQSRGFSALYAGFKFKAFHLGGGGALMAFLIPFFSGIILNNNKGKELKNTIDNNINNINNKINAAVNNINNNDKKQ
jgi:hypothetical protein